MCIVELIHVNMVLQVQTTNDMLFLFPLSLWHLPLWYLPYRIFFHLGKNNGRTRLLQTLSIPFKIQTMIAQTQTGTDSACKSRYQIFKTSTCISYRYLQLYMCTCIFPFSSLTIFYNSTETTNMSYVFLAISTYTTRLEPLHNISRVLNDEY